VELFNQQQQQDEAIEEPGVWITWLAITSMIQFIDHILASNAEPGIMNVCL
jgi:hypothetical protein